MPEQTVTRRRGPMPREIIESFRSILSLPIETLQKIGKWLSEHREFIGSGPLDGPNFERAASELEISESQLAQALSLIMTLLLSTQEPNELDAAVLKEFGLAEYEEKVRLLRKSIDINPTEVEFSRQKALVVQAGVPTLDDVDALCDLRAIFRRFPSANQTDSHLKMVRTLLGFEPVVTVSMELNDSTGRSTPFVFQVSEGGLRNLIKTLEESLGQLEVVKKAQETLTLPKDVS